MASPSRRREAKAESSGSSCTSASPPSPPDFVYTACTNRSPGAVSPGAGGLPRSSSHDSSSHARSAVCATAGRQRACQSAAGVTPDTAPRSLATPPPRSLAAASAAPPVPPATALSVSALSRLSRHHSRSRRSTSRLPPPRRRASPCAPASVRREKVLRGDASRSARSMSSYRTSSRPSSPSSLLATAGGFAAPGSHPRSSASST
mmetsp:Transcript_14439/g.46651  ORF Transcript_14439/g.46651 Transcript_14439/m.46651 type:complete len:205 (-) Transcript_14439:244-858(-)